MSTTSQLGTPIGVLRCPMSLRVQGLMYAHIVHGGGVSALVPFIRGGILATCDGILIFAGSSQEHGSSKK